MWIRNLPPNYIFFLDVSIASWKGNIMQPLLSVIKQHSFSSFWLRYVTHDNDVVNIARFDYHIQSWFETSKKWLFANLGPTSKFFEYIVPGEETGKYSAP